MQPQTPSTLAPGEIIGGYRIVSLIATGGMGAVYRARKDLLEKEFAIKVLHPTFAPLQEHRARFVREAKVAASLDHPSIVRVYDVGEDQGCYYLAMDYIEGTDLKSYVALNGPFSPRKALKIVRRIADAIAHAHDRGLIHRDIKPGNIILTPRGDAMLADFGLARTAGEDTEVTMAGQILGTPAYMSPEQCRGDPLDGRSDLYSIGATLYFLLSGKPPFSNDKPAVVIHRVIHELPPPLHGIVPAAPANVVALCQRLMSKHPGLRPQTAKELIETIDEVLVSRIVVSDEAKAPEVESAARPGNVVPIALLAALAIAMAAAVYLAIPSSSKPADVANAAARLDEGDAGGPHEPAGLPDPLGGLQGQAPPGTASPPPGPVKGPRDGRLTAEFKDLQPRVDSLVEAFGASDEAGIAASIDGQADAPAIRQAFRQILEAVKHIEYGSVKYRSTQGSPGHAQSHLFLCDMNGAPAMHIVIQWIRRDAGWFVEGVAATANPAGD